MRAVVLTGTQTLQVREAPKPEISDGEVLLRSRAVSICGTDMRIYRSGHTKLPANTPRILGHEMAGEVVQVGRGVTGVKPGDRVAVAPNFGCGVCRMCQRGWFHLCPDYGAIGLTEDGGMAEFVRIPRIPVQQGCLLPMPEGLSFEQAALNEPFACVYNGYTKCPTNPGDIALIVGAGPIGIMNMMMCRLAGAARIIVADLASARLQQARALGADHTVDSSRDDLVKSVLELTGGHGADVIITACPSPAVQEQVTALAADHARVNLFGGLPKGSPPVRMDSNAIHYKELVITGSHGCCTFHCEKALALQGSGAINLTPLITQVFDLAQTQQAMDAALAGRGLKTLIRPS